MLKPMETQQLSENFRLVDEMIGKIYLTKFGHADL